MNKQNLKASLISAIVVLCVATIGGYLWYLYSYDIPVSEPITMPVVEKVEEPNQELNEEIPSSNEVEEEVAVVKEVFKSPMHDGKVVRPFFSLSKSQQEQIDAIVEYDGVYRSNYGVDYASVSHSVSAIASGIVQEVNKDTLFGNKVVLQCGKYTVYFQSLDTVNVQQGQSVKQGDLIGTAGENGYDSSLGKHVHVIVEVDGRYFDLEKLINDKATIS